MILLSSVANFYLHTTTSASIPLLQFMARLSFALELLPSLAGECIGARRISTGSGGTSNQRAFAFACVDNTFVLGGWISLP